MNKVSDFHKKKSGVVVNTKSKDYKRARRRNVIRKEQDRVFGEQGTIARIEERMDEVMAIKDELDDMKTMLANILRRL